jgi:hypothetical protein
LKTGYEIEEGQNCLDRSLFPVAQLCSVLEFSIGPILFLRICETSCGVISWMTGGLKWGYQARPSYFVPRAQAGGWATS